MKGSGFKFFTVAAAVSALVGGGYYVWSQKQDGARGIASYGSQSSKPRQSQTTTRTQQSGSKTTTTTTRKTPTSTSTVQRTQRRVGGKVYEVKRTSTTKKDFRGRTVEVNKRVFTTPSGKNYTFSSRRKITPAIQQRSSRFSDRYDRAMERRHGGGYFDSNPALHMMIGMYSDNPLMCALAGFSGYCFMGMMLNNEPSQAHASSFDQGSYTASNDSISYSGGGANFIDDAPDEVVQSSAGLLDECIIKSEADEISAVVNCMNKFLHPKAQLTIDKFCTNKDLANIRELVDDNLYLSDGGCDSAFNQELRDAEKALQNYQDSSNEKKDDGSWF